MASIKEVTYRSVDELIDSVRIDLSSYQSNGDIDAANLIKVALKINYELGLRIHQPKETMVEICKGRAALPADFYQMLIALSCYNYRVVSEAPWNGDVILEEFCPPGSGGFKPSNCPCWKVVSVGGYQTTYVDCTGISHSMFFPDGTTNLCATSIDTVNGHGGPTTATTSSFCYPGTNGVYDCSPQTCNICSVEHTGTCPELVVNPYPLGQCRTICSGTEQQATIRMLEYCSTQVFCWETFERLWIVPNVQASGFSTRAIPFNGNPNTASINGRFLELHQPNCNKVYIQYLGAMEDERGNLLVLDHPTINFYYEWALKHYILELLYLNGEADIERRLAHAEKQMQEYKLQALNIVNTPNMRDVLNTNYVLKSNHNRQYYSTISRYFGYLGWGGWSSGTDPYNVH